MFSISYLRCQCKQCYTRCRIKDKAVKRDSAIKQYIILRSSDYTIKLWYGYLRIYNYNIKVIFVYIVLSEYVRVINRDCLGLTGYCALALFIAHNNKKNMTHSFCLHHITWRYCIRSRFRKYNCDFESYWVVSCVMLLVIQYRVRTWKCKCSHNCLRRVFNWAV